MMARGTATPAGIRVRLRAFGFDYVPIAAYIAVLTLAGATVTRFWPSIVNALFGGPVRGEATAFVLLTAPVMLYFALSEASPRQATWGKRKNGLRVTTLDGGRLSPARSLARSVLKFIPWELAHAFIWQVLFASNPSSPVYAVGFSTVWLMVGANVASMLVSPARQTLYDRLAGTLVIRDTPPIGLFEEPGEDARMEA